MGEALPMAVWGRWWLYSCGHAAERLGGGLGAATRGRVAYWDSEAAMAAGYTVGYTAIGGF
jgi:hypothetical protein